MKFTSGVLRRAAPLVLAVIFGVLPALATTWTVTNTDDSGPGSLRDAIANAAAQGDTINFALAYPATITLSRALVLNKSVVIRGPGSDNLTVTTGGKDNVLYITSGVEVDNLTVAGGDSLLGGCIYNAGNTNLYYVVVSHCGENQDTQFGAGIFNGGIMLIAHSTIDDNVAGYSGEIGEGAGIYNTTALGVTDGGSLQILFSDIRANRAVGEQAGQPCGAEQTGPLVSCGAGGGIYNHLGFVSLYETTVENNDAAGGGGIYNEGGTLGVSNSAITGNSATLDGSAIEVGNNDDVSIVSSTISGNTWDVQGLFPPALLDYTGKTLVITNTTIAENTGGGILVLAPKQPVRIAFTSIADNNSGPGIESLYEPDSYGDGGNTIILNSVLSNNGGQNCDFNLQGLGSLGHNFSDDTSCAGALTQANDHNGVPVGLDPTGLQNNGGPTQTIRLLGNSPAINAVPLSFCTDGNGQAVRTDQRGDPRPVGPACDAGAFEFFLSVNPVLSSQIYDVVDQVQSLSIPPVPKGLLTLEGDTAAVFVNIGNDNLAIDELTAFVVSVNVLNKAKLLTSQQSGDLTTPIQNVIKELAAGSSPQ